MKQTDGSQKEGEGRGARGGAGKRLTKELMHMHMCITHGHRQQCWEGLGRGWDWGRGCQGGASVILSMTKINLKRSVRRKQKLQEQHRKRESLYRK